MPKDHDTRNLMEGVYIEGDLSEESVRVLGNPEIAKQLPASLAPRSVKGGEVLLVILLVDDSNSIDWAHATQAIRDGHNRLIKLLHEKVPEVERVLIATHFLNGEVINDFVSVREAELLDGNNYDPADFGGTPLYHQSVLTLGTAMLQVKALQEEGCRVRTITLIMSDGQDSTKANHSEGSHDYSTPAAHVAHMAKDMRQRSGNHLVAAYAVGYGKELVTEFTQMGIEPKWILNSPDALASLLTFAEAAVQASLSQESFERLLKLPEGFKSLALTT